MTRATRLLVAFVAMLGLFATACQSQNGPAEYEITAQFARTYNLFPGSVVRVLGVDVGKITDVGTDPADDFVTVTILMDGDVQVPADARAIIIPAALLGERYIQLDPPFTGGATLEEGATIGLERTIVPSEFDEILESLNNFVGEIDDTELARLVDNLAGALDGNGAALATTIDSARGAINVLRENDDELIALASRLSDLNETVASRDGAIAKLIGDFDTVMTSLSDDRGDINAALRGLVRVSDELATLLERHRPDLQADIETLTRVGRTAQRNLDQISLSILSQAELFRHAGRVLNLDNNWLPLVDHAGELGKSVADAIGRRVVGVCIRAGLPADQCENLDVGGAVPPGICLPPIIACPPTGQTDDGEDMLTLAETLRRVVTEVPEMRDALQAEADQRRRSLEQEVGR